MDYQEERAVRESIYRSHLAILESKGLGLSVPMSDDDIAQMSDYDLTTRTRLMIELVRTLSQ